MSLITPKTIVITTLPGKSAHERTVAVDMDDIYGVEEGGGPRKRRRLTHLSPDEKMMRRKLKNRVAAQTARDRKKALMTDLEVQVSDLMEENRRLQKENSNLKNMSNKLEVENTNLKERLGLRLNGTLIKSEVEPAGSAVSDVSLPQGQTQTPSRRVTPVAVLALSLYLMLLNSSGPAQKKSQKISQLLPSLSPEQIAQIAPLLKWWGHQQQSWNPSMN